MKLRRVFMCMAVALLAMMVVFGCSGGDGEKTPTATEPIKIGAIFSVTGGAARLGGPEKNAALMIQEQVNNAGGIKGRTIELIIEDDAGIVENTVNAIQKLIHRDNVVAVIGPTRSGNGMAVAPIAQESRIPLVSCAAAVTQQYPEGDMTKPVYPYVFKTPQNDSHCAITIFKDCQAKGFKKVAIITGTTGFGAAGRAELQRYAGKYDIDLVADETYPPDASDLTPILTKIKAEKPQAVINWSIVEAQALIAGQMKQIGLDVQLYQSHGFGNKAYITEAAEGILFPAGRLLVLNDIDPSDVQYDVLTKFKNDYETKYGEEVSTFAGHAYDALWMVLKAIETTDADRDLIRGGLEATNNFIGTAGVFNMAPDDHCGLTEDAFVMVTVKDGEFRLASAVQ